MNRRILVVCSISFMILRYVVYVYSYVCNERNYMVEYILYTYDEICNIFC